MTYWRYFWFDYARLSCDIIVRIVHHCLVSVCLSSNTDVSSVEYCTPTFPSQWQLCLRVTGYLVDVTVLRAVVSIPNVIYLHFLCDLTVTTCPTVSIIRLFNVLRLQASSQFLSPIMWSPVSLLRIEFPSKLVFTLLFRFRFSWQSVMLF